MPNDIRIYFSGSIKKGGADDNKLCWTDEDMDQIAAALAPRRVVRLNPAARSDDLSDYKGTFGRDLFQVFSADIILVDGRDKRGIGIGAEMLFAKVSHLPVISWVTKDSNYHRTDFEFLGQPLDEWIHPFIYGLSDAIVDDIQEAASAITRLLSSQRDQIRSASFLNESIAHYIVSQLPRDTEMLQIVRENPAIVEIARGFLGADQRASFERMVGVRQRNQKKM